MALSASREDIMEESVTHAMDILAALPRDVAYVGLALLLLAVAQLVKALLTPYSLREELTTRDNVAVGLSMAGYYAGVIIVCVGPLVTPAGAGVPLWLDLLSTAGYGLLGVVLLNAARVVVARVLLRDFSTVDEIIRDRNAGTGAVEMGAYIASALVVAGSLQGQGGGVHTTLACFALGQLGLVFYGALYRIICGYDVHAEIERDNVAAGVAFALNLVAMGLLSMKAVSGDFLGWPHLLVQFAVTYGIGLVFLVAVRFLVDYLLLPGVRIHHEIVNDRNLNAAWVEGVSVAGMAGLLIVVL